MGLLPAAPVCGWKGMGMATASANRMRILHVIRGTVKRFAIFITLAARAMSCPVVPANLWQTKPAIRPKCSFEDLFRRLKQRYSRAASQAVWKGILGKQESELRSTGARPGGPPRRMSPDVKEVRTIVVTGGADGIGRAVVQLCAARGDNLAVLDKNVEAAKMAAEDAIKRGAKCALGLCCDVSSEEQIEKAFEIIWNKLGVPYGLFTSAAVDLGGLVHELPAATWHQVLETNLNGTFLACKHAIRKMRQADTPGSIVCASSPTGFVALAGGSAGAYSATKGGISALMRCMAIDYARYGIRVNAVVPGATETRLMWNNVPSEDIPRMRGVLSKEIPLGRLAQPEEPARAVAWLLSEESSYVTGTHLVCDGGILAKASISV